MGSVEEKAASAAEDEAANIGNEATSAAKGEASNILQEAGKSHPKIAQEASSLQKNAEIASAKVLGPSTCGLLKTPCPSRVCCGLVCCAEADYECCGRGVIS